VDEKAFEVQIKSWEWDWVNGHKEFGSEPVGNALLTAKNMHRKYRAGVDALP